RVGVFTRTPDEHVLLLVAHHIVVDFWSLAILLRELGRLYSAERAGAAADLLPPAREYTHFVSWQEDMLSGAEGERLWQFWSGRLAGELPQLALHTDRRRTPARTDRGASFNFRLPSDLLRGVKSLGRSRGATLYMTLLAAYEALLHRHTGQTELVVGSPTTGRGRAEFTGVVGYFVNPLALRASVSGGQTFNALLEEVRRGVLSAFEHQEYPFAQLVERLQPARDPGRPPVFQTMFVLQSAPALDGQNLAPIAVCDTGARIEWAGHTLEPVELQQPAAQFDLMLTMAESADGLTASFEYSTDLFDRATVERMASHFRNLLGGIVADPDARLSELPLLEPGERRRLLVEFNDTRRDYGRDVCAHQLFEQHARRSPEAVALTFGGEQLTYGELNARANRLARHLRGLGVGPEVKVALLLERSAEMVVSLLAVLKAGGCYVPLDPGHPVERLRYMLEDSGAQVLLTRSARVPQLAPLPRLRTVCLDAEGATIAAGSAADPGHAPDADGLCYIIYTSGSTGQPKGVCVTHGGLSNYLLWARSAYGLGPGRGAPVHSPLGFDLTVTSLLVPLCAGASVSLLPEGHGVEHLAEA
ncbi:MAG TPA: condensation domain-containing protein, partial [Pyrinomonadaceae bacterium]